MFNLLVNIEAWEGGRGSFPDRLFEYTAEHLRARFSDDKGHPDFRALIEFPCLFVQEDQFDGAQAPARVGKVTSAHRSGGKIHVEYYFEADVPALSNAEIKKIATQLDIQNSEFSRTHWAVKAPDLFKNLLALQSRRRAQPKVFSISEVERVDDLVSVMMPFSSEFSAVSESIKWAAESNNLICRRADDIWKADAVIQDVVDLIDRARVVVADCTERNPNVFYEIGIAHALGKPVVLITQNQNDVPFDLRHLRYLKYLNNSEGLEALAGKLASRIHDIVEGS